MLGHGGRGGVELSPFGFCPSLLPLYRLPDGFLLRLLLGVLSLLLGLPVLVYLAPPELDRGELRLRGRQRAGDET